MRYYSYFVLGLHALVELIAGGIMLVVPTVFFPKGSYDMLELARAFGVGAFSVGVLSVLMFRFRQRESMLMGYMILGLYQTGIMVLQIRHPMEGTPPWVAPVFHGFFVLSFTWLGYKSRSK